MTAQHARQLMLGAVAGGLLLLVSAAAQDRFAPIEAALRSRDYRQALELCNAALNHAPGDPQLWTLQGVAHSELGNKVEALASFRHALQLAPDHVPALQQEAQLYYEADQLAAVPLLQHLLRLRPGDPMSHAMIAVLEYKQGNCKAALPHFEKAVTLLQSQVDGLHAYAVCLVGLKQLNRAADVLKRAAELKPNDPQELRVLASVELMANQPQAALHALQPLLASGAQDVETLELASSAYEGVHDTEKAVGLLRQAILLQPANTALYVQFANLSATHQSFQVGINVLNDGLALEPRAPSLYFARGMLYAQLADYEKAQADFESAYRLDPNQSLTTAAQGLMAVEQNDLDGALKTVQQRLVQKPDDPVLLYLKADILTQQGAEPGSQKFETALRSARHAILLNSGLAPAHAVLAKLYLQSGNYQEAIVECRESLRLNPKDQTSIYRLIQALRKTEHKDAIPALLNQLAQLRQEATREERERYRYKLVEGDAPTL